MQTLQIESREALAQVLEVELAELERLALSPAARRGEYYKHFTIPKRSGAPRRISAPVASLKHVQRGLLDDVFSAHALHDNAHGFRDGRSIVSNARAHVGSEVLVNIDLEDFFPSITRPRVLGLVRALGYSDDVAWLIACLCTEPSPGSARERVLPQGAPTSPILTNLLCRRLDARLTGLSEALGWRYTRYADDMSFSAPTHAEARHLGRILGESAKIVRQEGFSLNPKKTSIQRRGQHQEVTGLCVNEKVSVPRATLKRFRALLHKARTGGLQGLWWKHGEAPDMLASMYGFANFVAMVNEPRGMKLRALVDELGAPPPTTPPEPYQLWLF